MDEWPHELWELLAKLSTQRSNEVVLFHLLNGLLINLHTPCMMMMVGELGTGMNITDMKMIHKEHAVIVTMHAIYNSRPIIMQQEVSKQRHSCGVKHQPSAQQTGNLSFCDTRQHCNAHMRLAKLPALPYSTSNAHQAAAHYTDHPSSSTLH